MASGVASIDTIGANSNPDAIATATRNLAIACMELFERTAMQRHITVEQAARAHLCGAP